MEIPGSGYVVVGALMLFFGWLTVKYARRLVTVARMMRSGTRTTGTCVRVETEPYNRSDATRHFFAFRAPDGRDVEFEDLAGWSVKEGTEVTVAYDPRDPERTATIAGRGSRSPVLQCLALAAGCGMATLGFTAVFVFQVIGSN